MIRTYFGNPSLGVTDIEDHLSVNFLTKVLYYLQATDGKK